MAVMLNATGAHAQSCTNTTIFNVKCYGAVGDGSTDDTAAIQAAINAANTPVNLGKTVYFPSGTYFVSSTLVISNGDGITMQGDGIIRSFILRTGDYGDTLRIGGATSTDSMENVRISNLDFMHSYGTNWGSAFPGTMLHKPTSGAHIAAYGLSHAEIANCIFYNMPTQVHFVGGSYNYLVNNTFGGLYDDQNSSFKVTLENVLLEYDSVRSQLPTDYHLINNNFFGYITTARSQTIGSWTGNLVANIGSAVGLRIKGCELVQIEGGNFGSMNNSEISIEPQNGIGCLDISVHGTFFDSCGGNAIQIINAGGSSSARMVQIHGNNFNGEGNDPGSALYVGFHTDTTPSVYGLMFDGNMIGGGYGRSAVYLLSGAGINLSHNQMRNYNCVNGFTDYINAAGVYVDSNAHKVNLSDNSLGGSENFDGYPTNSSCTYGISFKGSDSTIHLNANVDFGVQTLTNSY